MELKVRHQELNDIVKKSGDNATLLNNEIDKLFKEMGNLKEIWQGIDANNFYDSLDDYLKQMKEIPKFFELINYYIDKIDKNYKQIDNEFAQALKRVGDIDEQ